MQAYESGGHAYHATLPTDSLAQFRDRVLKQKIMGLEKLCRKQWQLGMRVRALLVEKV